MVGDLLLVQSHARLVGNHRLVAPHGAHFCYLVGSIIARLYYGNLEHPHEVFDFDEVLAFGVLVAH